ASLPRGQDAKDDPRPLAQAAPQPHDHPTRAPESAPEMTFARRRIDLTFTIVEGPVTAPTGQSKLSLAGLRVETLISKPPSLHAGGNAQTRIYGMTLDHINQLSLCGLIWDGRQNMIEISAGDDQSGMTLIHKGIILSAEPDFSDQPDVAFNVFSIAAYDMQVK